MRLATFTADVTPPVGCPLIGGWGPPVKGIEDQLDAHGFVLLSDNQSPIVFVAVDWLDIRNTTYDQWREALAGAARTDPQRVIVHAVHQHEAPIADVRAQHILEERHVNARIFDPAFHERALQRVVVALEKSLNKPLTVTHIGLGQAKVDKIASNRRYIDRAGNVRHDRGSNCKDPVALAAPEGVIDPWLKTLSFWDSDKPLLALSGYAVHPMSYYHTGMVTADFPGLARRRRQREQPELLQIYGTGACGDVTAGKYNDGNHANRARLAERLYQAMIAAWKATERHPLTNVTYRTAPLAFQPSEELGYTRAEMSSNLTSSDALQRGLAALGLSWRERLSAGQHIDLPCLDLGSAQLVLLPAEAYVQYQLWAQQVRPDSFVSVLAFGDCGPGFIPTEQAWTEKDSNIPTYCWIARSGAEKQMMTALESAMKG